MNKADLLANIGANVTTNGNRENTGARVAQVLENMLSQHGEIISLSPSVETGLVLDNPHGVFYNITGSAYAANISFGAIKPGGFCIVRHNKASAPTLPATALDAFSFATDYQTGQDNYLLFRCLTESPGVVWAEVLNRNFASGSMSRIQDGDNDTSVDVESTTDDDLILFRSLAVLLGRLSGGDRLELGDVEGVGNGVKIDLNDSTQAIDITAPIVNIGRTGASYSILNVLLASIDIVAQGRSVANFANASQRIGDYASAGNGTHIEISDLNEFIRLFGTTIRLADYPNTRNDGSTSIALYPDVNGDLKVGPISGGGGVSKSVSASNTITLADNYTDHTGASDAPLTGDLILSLTNGNSGNKAVIKHNDAVVPSITGANVRQLSSLANNYVLNADNLIHLWQRDVPGGAPEVLLWISETANPDYISKYYSVDAFALPTSNPAQSQAIEFGSNVTRVMTFDPGERAVLKRAMPYDYAGGPIRVKFHWATSGGSVADTVGFTIKGVATKDDEDLAQVQGTEEVVYDIVTGLTDQMISGATDDVTIDGTPVSGTPVFIEMQLDALSESSAHLFGIEIQYQGKTVNTGIWTPSSDPAPSGGPAFLMDGIEGTHYVVLSQKKRYAASTEWGVMREDGGDAEFTIGWNGTDQDAAEITTRKGANGAWLKEWRNQVAGNEDVVQATFAQQPQLILDGTTGLYFPTWDPVAFTNMQSLTNWAMALELDFYMVARATWAVGDRGNQHYLYSSRGSAIQYGRVVSGYINSIDNPQSTAYTNGQFWDEIGLAQFTYRSSDTAANVQVRRANANNAMVSQNAVAGTMAGLVLGGIFSGSGSNWEGEILEFIITSRLGDTDRNTIETTLMADYGIV